MEFRDLKKFHAGEDLIKFLGGVLTLELDGSREDLPLILPHFKVTGSVVTAKGSYLVGRDEESFKMRVPVDRICGYIRYK